jgi:hypothetical protein
MWGHLRLLSYEHNARRLLAGDLGKRRKNTPPGSELLDRKAAQISYCILQAHEYYKAAEAVTIHTSPLLYFYGMLSLAKAVIVANDPVKLLGDIKYHGLRYDKAGGRAGALDEQTALLDGGVFDELTEVICNFRYPRRVTFKLKDILAISPELREVYEVYYGEPSRTVYGSAHVLSSDPYVIELSPAERHADIASYIPEVAEVFQITHGKSGRLTLKAGASRSKQCFAEYRPVVGGMYIVGDLVYIHDGAKDSRHLMPPLADYIAMYIMSDCVRYQQDLWGNVVQGKTTGAIGLVDLFISVSRRRYPNLILNTLFGEAFDYGSPGRIM